MANVLTFSSAFIRTAGLALDEGSKRIRINVSCSWTKEVREKMDWQEIEKPRGFKGRSLDEAAGSMSLIGELAGRTLTLTPNDKELRKHGCEIEIQHADKFELVTVKDGDSTRRELRFQIVTAAAGALGTIEGYADTIGQGKGELKISYVRQQELDLDPGHEQQVQDEVRRRATSKEED